MLKGKYSWGKYKFSRLFALRNDRAEGQRLEMTEPVALRCIF